MEKQKPFNKLRFQQTIAFAGIFLFIAKLVAWKITNSNAVFSDAMETIVNIIAAFLGLYSLQLAAKPRDKEHPYGHGKVEFITSGVEGILIIIAGFIIIFQSISSIIHGHEILELNRGMIIIFIAGLINYILGWYSVYYGRKEDSMVLIASGKHLQTDTITSVGLLLSLGIMSLTHWYWLDNAVALLFALYIIYVGYKIVRKALSGVMDETDEQLLGQIINILEEYRHIEWIDVHNMKIQKYGANLHIDAHLTFPWYYSLRDAHFEMEKVILLLADKIDREIEFNFHMDYCKPTSCAICQIMDCPVREYPFEKKIKWTAENVRSPKQHSL